ncbi:MAG TPA: XrtA/PEP-CTERM system histidine kinase PrsK [Aliidongia sp.]|uniref:XrtA/PEP-CTERM system histidine kinase PrsK n=1 Tax=Aliidongia sp. TaxID=1914230 RepID=UPI002DDD2EB4|nr:XrtA/PEP-CTERM system histidine kinase PrsK [Aliidongia sp.]HEV2673681.1 XrtA/PEP-CTERM system histidine kinase PrsK [Aliidongia sp.]
MLQYFEIFSSILSGILFFGLALQMAVAKNRSKIERAGASIPPLATVARIALPWLGVSPIVIWTSEALHLAAWVALLGLFRCHLAQNTGYRALALKLVPPLIITIGIGWFNGAPDPALVSIIALIGILIVGLMELEQIIRTASREESWGIKHAAIGLGAILALNLYFYAEGLLLLQLNPTLAHVRFLVYALCAPLLMISTARLRGFRRQIRLSRQGAFHSATLVLVGLYFLAMALAGYAIRLFGVAWGELPQVAFGFAALIFLPMLLASGSARAKLKVFIAKNFFSLRYDYREEWLRFIRTVAHDVTAANLHLRIIKGIGDIVEATGGALWQRSDEDKAYLLSDAWNMGALRLPAVPLTASLISYLEQTGAIIDLFEYRAEPARYPNLEIPEWLRDHPRCWLVVPLRNRDRMSGFVVLGEPRARRPLIWEDYDILKTVGHHAAGYMTEEKVLNDLSDARRLEAFNRRFAFIIHDIKNVVSQMALMLRNAERFAGNPDFQKDMLETVANSVNNLTALLQQIKADTQPDEPMPAVALPPPEPLMDVLEPVARRWQRQHAGFAADIAEAASLHVTLSASDLSAVLDHLLQNAVEAAGTQGHITLAVSVEEDRTIVSVTDDGSGMSEDYIREQLFRPLVSGKSDGFGLGAFQCRELVRAMGGRLEVASTPGVGTCFKIYLRAQSAAASMGNDRFA